MFLQTVSESVIKNATTTTANANYLLEYGFRNNKLTKVSATIVSPSEEYIGNITYENGNVACNFPSVDSAAPFFNDFDLFMQEIKELSL